MFMIEKCECRACCKSSNVSGEYWRKQDHIDFKATLT